MNDTFLIDVVEWLASDATDPLESVTNAEITISIGQNHVTEVEDFQSKTVRKTIRASAGLVAMWILNNWWRILCEPDSDTTLDKDLNWKMSHVMPAIGGGYVWPDLVFKGSDGSQIYAECKRSSYRDDDTYSPIRYLNGFSTSISVETFEKSVSSSWNAYSIDWLRVVFARLICTICGTTFNMSESMRRPVNIEDWRHS